MVEGCAGGECWYEVEECFIGCRGTEASAVVAIGGSMRLMIEGEARAFGEANVGCEGGCDGLDEVWSVEYGCVAVPAWYL